MTRCEEFHDAMAADAVGEIDAGAKASLDAHLEHCPACSMASSRLRSALGGLSAEPAPDPGPLYWVSFGGRVRERIAANRATSRHIPLFLAAALVAALGLALATAIRWSGRMAAGPGAPATEGGPASAVAAAGTPGHADAGEAVAEARFEAALKTMMAEEGAGAASDLEAIIDEVAPGDPFVFAGGLDEIDDTADGGSGV